MKFEVERVSDEGEFSGEPPCPDAVECQTTTGHHFWSITFDSLGQFIAWLRDVGNVMLEPWDDGTIKILIYDKQDEIE